MKKWLNDETLYKKFVSFTIAGVLIVLSYFFFSYFASVKAFIKNLLSILSPFIWGIFLAFILYKPEGKLEKILPFKKEKTKRLWASILMVIAFLSILVLFFVMLMPQLGQSMSQLTELINDVSQNASAWVEDLSKDISIPDEVLSRIYEFLSSLVTSLWSLVSTSIPNLLILAKDTVNVLINFVVGIIVAVYILTGREALGNGFKKLFKVILESRTYETGSKLFYLSVDKFSSFISGKLVDSLIIGILCFIVMNILKLDYSVLISFIVGVTNIIPFFGPFIGAIPSALILLIVSPTQALIFVIMVLVLQQLDGNIIGPFILGDSVGLSSIWIMFAIIVGGGYFGFFGMLLGVPVFAVIYFMIKEYIDSKTKDEK